MSARVLIAVLLGASVSMASAQDARQSFEVASVKPNVTNDNSWSYGPRPGGQFAATNTTLSSLIELAYGVRGDQVLGGPDWIRRDRWDVLAKTETEVPFETVRMMLRRLLTDRFALRLRHQQRVMPVFELRLARADRRLGKGLRSVSSACRADPNEKPAANVPARGSKAVITDLDTTRGRCVPLSLLVANISSRLETTVVDRTGLTGAWDFDFTAATDTAAADLPAGARTDSPSLFAALPEQLGLTLQRARGPVPVIVVEAAIRAEGD